MEIHIGDRVADVSLVNKEGNKVQLTIDGVPYDVDIVMAENGSCSILHNGKSYNAELIRKDGGKSYTVNAHYQSYNIDIIDSQAKYLRMRKGGEEKQQDKIVSPMPGQDPRKGGRPSGSGRHRSCDRSHENAEQLQGEQRMYGEGNLGE